MGRIFKFSEGLGEEFIDLGNIKSIFTSPFGAVTIHLLKSSEYVINPKTNELELVKPEISYYFPNKEKLNDFKETITEEWEKYLESKEI